MAQMTSQTPTGFGLRQPSGALSSRPAEVMPVAKFRSDREVPHSKALPCISPLLLNWFTWYSRRYLRRHFHSLRVSLDGRPPASLHLPLVIYSNHAAWWDALVGLVLKAEFFSGRKAFAPIDSKALEKYKMFRRLGFFGVEPGTQRGAVPFLRTAENILRKPDSLLVVTPQGRFADVRERPVRFQAGLGHLATRVEHAVFLPMATEFIFWEERLPEILVRFGEPVEVGAEPAPAYAAKDWTTFFEQKLEAIQDALATEAKRRNPDEFQIVLRGGAGQGGIYDWWRSAKAKLRGQDFRKEHGTK
jgi:1-acyl-sn-glycerol-3-phosphate acyltransferase